MAEYWGPDAARGALRDALLRWKQDGVEDAVIPVYRPWGTTPSFYSLDDDDALVIVDGRTIENSVALSTGDGLEGGTQDGAVRLP